MAQIELTKLTGYCDRLLKTATFTDYDGAVNGLQVENGGSISKIAAAVDGTLVTARRAVEAGADLMIVHHGFFWGPTHPWTGRRRELLKLLIEHDLAVYSSHLPLDAHPVLGNNARLGNALGFGRGRPFFAAKGQDIGLRWTISLTREELERRLTRAVGGRVTVLPGGPGRCRRIGIVTGGAGGDLKTAAAEGIDTFITGEGPHWSFGVAEDLGLNVFYGGHYATETFGVKALAAHLSAKFRVPWTFIDHPTGL